MSSTTLHTLWACDAGGTLIDEITNHRVATQIQRMMRTVGGEVEPKFVCIGEQRPSIFFTTLALARALAAVGADGLTLSAAANFWFQKMVVDSGTRAGALSHLKLTVNAGIIVPRTLRAAQGDYATLEYECACRYNGTNEPIVPLASQSLTGTPAVDEKFTVGPVNINGAALDGIKETTIDFGLQLLLEVSEGDIWPTFIAIMERATPLITIRTTDALAFNTLGLDGVAQGATDSEVYFRKKAADGGNELDATAEHIKVSIDAGMVTVDEVAGDYPGVLESVVHIVPVYDGTNALFAVSTASAIT
jgi:hypothetical protein